MTCVCVLSQAQLCPTLCDPMDCSPPLSVVLTLQKYWSGLPFPPPGDLPAPGIEPVSPVPPALAGRFPLLSHMGSRFNNHICFKFIENHLPLINVMN